MSATEERAAMDERITRMEQEVAEAMRELRAVLPALRDATTSSDREPEYSLLRRVDAEYAALVERLRPIAAELGAIYDEQERLWEQVSQWAFATGEEDPCGRPILNRLLERIPSYKELWVIMNLLALPANDGCIDTGEQLKAAAR